MQAFIKLTMLPTIMALGAIDEISDFLCGIMAASDPIIMPIAPMLAKPQSAYVDMTIDRLCNEQIECHAVYCHYSSFSPVTSTLKNTSNDIATSSSNYNIYIMTKCAVLGSQISTNVSIRTFNRRFSIKSVGVKINRRVFASPRRSERDKQSACSKQVARGLLNACRINKFFPN